VSKYIFFILLLHLSVQPISASITNEEMLGTMLTTLRIYKPIFAAKGITLEIYTDWSSEEENGYAFNLRHLKFQKVRVKGGMLRKPDINLDGIKALICHELGHFLGGYPYYKSKRGMSCEGQSDYWAASSCLKKMFANENNSAYLETIYVPQVVREGCDSAYALPKDANLCVRVTMAGYNLKYASTQGFLRFNLDLDEEFTSPDLSEVSKTYLKHPKSQCRVDTYFQGALGGKRPRCWFKPKNYGI